MTTTDGRAPMPHRGVLSVRALRSATASTPPPLVPVKMPSVRASACDVWTASSPLTWQSSS
jgi:hypothetical protein